MSGTPVSVDWDEPDGDARGVLVLAHGAGGDLNDPLLRALGRGLAGEGVAVARFNFPYRDAGRRAPGAQTQSEACYRDVASSARRPDLPLWCGGKSYGGRMATHIVADGFVVDRLVLLSYPLHPPGKPERLRDAHLADVSVPMLFVHGTKDPFARPDLMDRTIAALPLAVYHPIEGADHSLRVRGRTASEVHAEITAVVAAFLAR